MSLPPAQPAYIFRGHSAPIHTTTFIRDNSRLITGDAEGWLVIWSLATKRAVVVWRAHNSVILGVSAWGNDKIITHGKDNKLVVWSLPPEDESSLDTTLPIDPSPTLRKAPWVLHILDVNTMNFCSFASCAAEKRDFPSDNDDDIATVGDELLIAVPTTLSSETVDIFHLPSQTRIHTLPRPPIPTTSTIKSGMVMSIRIFHSTPAGHLTVISGYESGHAVVSTLLNGAWETLYIAQPHSQPILSLDICPSKSFFLSSSADALIVKHPLPSASAPTPSPSPTITSATSSQPVPRPGASSPAAPSLLSSLLSQQGSSTENPAISPIPAIIQAVPKLVTTPMKVLKTGHSGQHSLTIRSDGKIFTTAGWDGRIRVYSTKGMRELAVLKWHSTGCFAVGFAEVKDDEEKEGKEANCRDGESKEVVHVGERGRGEGRGKHMDVREKRAREEEGKHWVVAGSKDGKVSLWEIY